MEKNLAGSSAPVNSNKKGNFDDNKAGLRSKDRCHLLSRCPVYDKNGKIWYFNFQYSKGLVIKPDSLEPKHVKHVMTGYYIRRSMDIFTSLRAGAICRMPLTPDILKYVNLLPLGRFVLRIPERQEHSPTTVHILSQLSRTHIKLAADVYTIIYTNWSQCLRFFDFMIIDMNLNVEEQSRLAKNIRKFKPDIKLICVNGKTRNDAAIGFEIGADLVSCPVFTADIFKSLVDIPYVSKHKELISDVYKMIYELMLPHPQYYMYFDLIKQCPQLEKATELIRNYFVYFEKKRNDSYGQRTDKDRYLEDMDEFYSMDGTSTLEDDINEMPDDILQGVLTIGSLCASTLQFQRREDSEFGRFNFEGIEKACIRIKFIYELIRQEEKYDVRTLPIAQMGVCSSYADYESLEFKANLEYQDMINRYNELLEQYPVIAEAINCVKALERSEISTVKQLVSDGVFELWSILRAYERAVIWAVELNSYLVGLKTIPSIGRS